MRSLLVYELVPDSTQFFVFTSPTEEQTKLLTTANGVFLNEAELTEEKQDAVDQLNELLADEKRPSNVQKLDPTLAPVEGPFDVVYFSGFLL